MYAIHHRVKRTQLYLDEDLARLLAAESRRRHLTISALVRDAAAEVYGRRPPDDRAAIIERVAGVWAERSDLGDTAALVRGLRRSSRPARWMGEGDGGQAPPRQRRRH